MYLEHYGLTEPPFRITPHTDFFFAGANRGSLLEALLYALIHDEGIIKVSGEVGSGKTMLCRMLMERLPASVALVYLANPSLSRQDILWAIADELGLQLTGETRHNQLLRALQNRLVELYGAGRRVIVLVDEAHAMPIESLEEIRLLSNLESSRHKLMQLVLFGQPELDVVLARPDMRQLRERITHHFTLEPLVCEDVGRYLDFRMRAAGYKGPEIFSPRAVRAIADASLGLTRRINILADKSLLAAFAAGRHQVTPREVHSAIADSAFAAAMPSARPHVPWWVAALAGASLTGALLAAFWPNQPPAKATVAETEATTAAPDAVPLPMAAPSPPTSLPATTPVAASPAPSRLQQALADSQPWLESVADDRWFLQLGTVAGDQPQQVEQLLRRLSEAGVDMAQVRVYHSSLSGQPRYGVIYGDFASRRAAVRAGAALPADILALRPYARQAVRLKPRARRQGSEE